MKRARMPDLQPVAGFSLVEVAVAGSIMLLLAAVALPNIMRRLQYSRLDGAVSTLVGELRTARMQALSQSRAFAAELDGPGQRLQIESDRNNNGVIETNETVTVDLQKFTGVSASSAKAGGTFTSRGAFTCDGGSWEITLAAPGLATEYVYVFPGGQVERSRSDLQ